MTDPRHEKIAELMVAGLVSSLVPAGTRDSLKNWAIKIIEDELCQPPPQIPAKSERSGPTDWRKEKPTPIEERPVVKWGDVTVQFDTEQLGDHDQ